MVALIDRPSPNHDARPERGGEPCPPDLLLLHYTGMQTGEAALERLCDPAAKVSAHYLVEEDGRVFRLVPEHRRAWHAGLAAWAGETDVNGLSLGIELVNPGHEFGYRPFPERQMAALIELLHVLKAKYSISPARVIGHSDVAPRRKTDPGELFDWPRLAKEGLARPVPAPHQVRPDPAVAQIQFTELGYGFLDEDFEAVVTAFQRRFRPAAVTGAFDSETAGILAALADS
ncbi:N-acetylmuramoyl-L-alanine amidase [Algihabitans albus]|uniref:N-acetylmuramoyl-L-alanine amidase n=1 Tax=Algihabitans albus TaxID=2164067 RepID=UPI000E5CD997|nr:N-acetylmuramoyl-L-alanine amidase [Algihabitans albus]